MDGKSLLAFLIFVVGLLLVLIILVGKKSTDSKTSELKKDSTDSSSSSGIHSKTPLRKHLSDDHSIDNHGSPKQRNLTLTAENYPSNPYGLVTNINGIKKYGCKTPRFGTKCERETYDGKGYKFIGKLKPGTDLSVYGDVIDVDRISYLGHEWKTSASKLCDAKKSPGFIIYPKNMSDIYQTDGYKCIILKKNVNASDLLESQVYESEISLFLKRNFNFGLPYLNDRIIVYSGNIEDTEENIWAKHRSYSLDGSYKTATSFIRILNKINFVPDGHVTDNKDFYLIYNPGPFTTEMADKAIKKLPVPGFSPLIFPPGTMSKSVPASLMEKDYLYFMIIQYTPDGEGNEKLVEPSKEILIGDPSNSEVIPEGECYVSSSVTRDNRTESPKTLEDSRVMVEETIESGTLSPERSKGQVDNEHTIFRSEWSR